MSLTAAQFLSKQVPKTREVVVEGIGSFFAIERDTAARSAFVDRFFKTNGQLDSKKLAERRERLLVWGVVDAGGQPVFGEANVRELAAVATEKTEPLVAAVCALNGIALADFETLLPLKASTDAQAAEEAPAKPAKKK